MAFPVAKTAHRPPPWTHMHPCHALAFLLLVAACQTDSSAGRTKEGLPPLVPPEANIMCPVGGLHGVATPPAVPTPQQLTREEVAAFLADHTPALNGCYEDRVRRGYAIEGNVGVRFTVTPQGYVKDLCVVEDGTGDGAFISCLFGEMGSWQFPARPVASEVRHRWRFKHGS